MRNSTTGFPAWFDALGQQAILGPFPLSLLIFFALVVIDGRLFTRSLSTT